ncbi:MAG TPA: tail fiber domain-containing protein, partial [Thermoanaerobaculia bacterium]|nr:tail fiber domain-containing protein [Thermoanaerobaculia bacterium]
VPNLIYTTVVPCRILDTRLSTGGRLVAGTVRTFNVVGNTTGTYFTDQGGPSGGCSVPGFQVISTGEAAPKSRAASAAAATPDATVQGPPQVQAVVINLAVVAPSGPGFLNAWPTDHSAPPTSLINYSLGTNLANQVVLAVRQDTQGNDISVVAAVSGAHLIGDIVGYFSSGSVIPTTGPNASQNNLFIGPGAGNQNSAASTGSDNVGLGAMALPVLTGGGLNIAMGLGAMSHATVASENIGIGANALNNLTTGTFNIAIGLDAGDNLSSESNNIFIGSNGLGGDNGVIRIGNTEPLGQVQTATYIAAISGVTSSGGTAVYINSNGQLGTLTSSLRYKQDLEDMGDSSKGLMDLHPVVFHYKPEYDDGSHLLQYGLVAEEVAKVYPELVQSDQGGRPIAVRTHFINAMMLNEVQRQHRTIDAQQARIDEQQAQIEELQREVHALLQQRQPTQSN